MDEKYFVGAMFDPVEGNVDPSGVTRAFARSAQLAGAEVVQHTRVEAIRQLPDGRPGSSTAASRARSPASTSSTPAGCGRARSAGCAASSCRCSRWSTCTWSPSRCPEWNESSGREGFHAMDFAGEVYMRKEGDGLLLGTYEPNGVPWSPQTTPWDFGHQLLAAGPRPDRRQPRRSRSSTSRSSRRSASSRGQRAVHVRPRRQPAGRAGPGSARPLGGVRGDGRAQPGRRRRARAGQLDHPGRPGLRRVGRWMSRGSASGPRRTTRTRRCARTTAAGSGSPTPTSSSAAARPLLTTPIHGRLDAANAVWGARTGSSTRCGSSAARTHAGGRAVETPTLRRSNAWDAGGERERRGARRRRADRDDELREARVHRTGCAGLPRPDC